MIATDELQAILEEEVKAIFDRIAEDKQTPHDILDLRSLIISGDNNVVQIGGQNIHIDEGKDIHVGERIYQGQSAEAIKAVMHQALSERDEIGVRMIQQLDKQIEEKEEQKKELQKKIELEEQKKQELEEQKKQELAKEIEVSNQTIQNLKEEEITVEFQQKEYLKEKEYIQQKILVTA